MWLDEFRKHMTTKGVSELFLLFVCNILMLSLCFDKDMELFMSTVHEIPDFLHQLGECEMASIIYYFDATQMRQKIACGLVTVIAMFPNKRQFAGELLSQVVEDLTAETNCQNLEMYIDKVYDVLCFISRLLFSTYEKKIEQYNNHVSVLIDKHKQLRLTYINVMKQARNRRSPLSKKQSNMMELRIRDLRQRVSSIKHEIKWFRLDKSNIEEWYAVMKHSTSVLKAFNWRNTDFKGRIFWINDMIQASRDCVDKITKA